MRDGNARARLPAAAAAAPPPHVSSYLKLHFTVSLALYVFINLHFSLYILNIVVNTCTCRYGTTKTRGVKKQNIERKTFYGKTTGSGY